MRAVAERRLSFHVVDRYLQPHLIEHCPDAVATAQAGVTLIAARLGVSTRQIRRWRHIGLRTVDADRIAACLGLHPAYLFGDDWDQACDLEAV